MKKKILCITLFILALASLMIAEYRFIMVNLCPSVDDDAIYIEFFGQVDAYDICEE